MGRLGLEEPVSRAKKSKKGVGMSSLQSMLKPRLQPSSPPFRGLCSTCEHTDHCTFPRDPERPVMQCEELASFVEMRLATVRSVPADGRLASKGWEANQEAPAYTGLCSTCEQADYCTFPRPTGGVWCCEEYR